MNESDAREVFARISTMNFLLEVLYMQQFKHDPAGLRQLFAELQRLTRDAPSTAEPTGRAELIEQQARVATHLQRFEQAVLHRIASGRIA